LTHHITYANIMSVQELQNIAAGISHAVRQWSAAMPGVRREVDEEDKA
jgi:hypothetical protein